MSDEEARFRDAVKHSWDGPRRLAQIYQSRGYSVLLPDFRLRPSIEERHGYGDAFDMLVSRSRIWPIEVKARMQLDFTSAEDYPYDTVFVDRAEKVEANINALSGYIIINRTHAAFIDAKSFPQWTRTERFDRKKGYPLTVYECPRSLVRFRAIQKIAA